MKYIPKYDKDFAPMIIDYKKYLMGGKILVKVAIERNDSYNFIKDLYLIDDSDKTLEIAQRFIQGVLWSAGGFKIFIYGSGKLIDKLRKAYNGEYKVDAKYMKRIYQQELEIIEIQDIEDFPLYNPCSISIGGHLNGNRIGLDVGGSDKKVSAVVNGEVIYSEEVVWHPKINSDYRYHYAEITKSLKTAASKMDWVDCIGVSSAGDIVDNKVVLALLYKMVNEEDFDKYIRDIYINAAKEIGENIPVVVANDGDVSALAGSIYMKNKSLLGLAFGTSEAAGYIDADGNLNGFLSELAFMPIDNNKNSPPNEFNDDYGVGTNYFSQDAVIKLGQRANVDFSDAKSPAEKLKVVQKMAAEGNQAALDIFNDIGIYLGYTVPYYAEFYDLKNVMLLGRVMSGIGGEIILNTAKKILKEVFNSEIDLFLPDEMTRRVGQSIAAASLPRI